jgi:hypothetical protein
MAPRVYTIAESCRAYRSKPTQRQSIAVRRMTELSRRMRCGRFGLGRQFNTPPIYDFENGKRANDPIIARAS